MEGISCDRRLGTMSQYNGSVQSGQPYVALTWIDEPIRQTVQEMRDDFIHNRARADSFLIRVQRGGRTARAPALRRNPAART
jgi:hypothetical protein